MDLGNAVLADFGLPESALECFSCHELLYSNMPSANFAQCGQRYMNDPALIARWNYTGPVLLIDPNPNTQITLEGCFALCGRGNDWYPWSTASQTITTWVLPLIGTLLQAPFESNAFWRTVKAISRWLGSPMVSLSYILWNIQVSAKSALFGIIVIFQQFYLLTYPS